jgi:hypothetical protein
MASTGHLLMWTLMYNIDTTTLLTYSPKMMFFSKENCRNIGTANSPEAKSRKIERQMQGLIRIGWVENMET